MSYMKQLHKNNEVTILAEEEETNEDGRNASALNKEDERAPKSIMKSETEALRSEDDDVVAMLKELKGKGQKDQTA